MIRRPRPIHIFLPVLLMPLVQNLISMFMAQVLMCFIVVKKGPIGASTLVDETLAIVRTSQYNLWFSVISGAACLILYVIWYRKLKKTQRQMEAEEKTEVVLTKAPLSLVISGIIITTVAAQFFLSMVVEFTTMINPAWLIEYKSIMDRVGINVVGAQEGFNPLIIIYVLIVAPLMEEFAFRGISLSYAKKVFPSGLAIFISSMLFAVLHGNMLQGIATFVFALILGYICYLSDRLWITVAMHVMYNAISLFLPNLVSIGENPIVTFLIVFTSMTGMYIGVRCIAKAYER